LIEAVEEPVEDLLACDLSFLVGVVALGLEGRAELDGGDEEGAGLADDSKWQSSSTGRAQ